MPFEISTADPRPLYVQIMDEVRRGIVVGRWRAGDVLPSARELSVELRVNPNTVRQAYRELEREGTVEGRRGSGTFVRKGAGGPERRQVVEEMARRMAAEAYRSGIDVPELVAALERHGRGGADETKEAG